jgi:hypothetical protein
MFQKFFKDLSTNFFISIFDAWILQAKVILRYCYRSPPTKRTLDAVFSTYLVECIAKTLIMLFGIFLNGRQ